MLIFLYTVYNLFINMAMSTNIIYLNFIFKGMPIRAFVLRGGPPAEDRCQTTDRTAHCMDLHPM